MLCDISFAQSFYKKGTKLNDNDMSMNLVMLD